MQPPWHRRIVDALSTPPTTLYHATTPRKLARYVATGAILAPVQGFDTLKGVQEWARLVNGRTVILKFDVVHAQALPDHHNTYGLAWWTPVAVSRWTVVQPGFT